MAMIMKEMDDHKQHEIELSPTTNSAIPATSSSLPPAAVNVDVKTTNQSSSSMSSSSSSGSVAGSLEEWNDDHTINHHHTTTGTAATLLTVWQAAGLMTADVLGTGLLALPENIAVLGRPFGLTFLILNLPINWIVGYWLSRTADGVDNDNEQQQQCHNSQEQQEERQTVETTTTTNNTLNATQTKRMRTNNPNTPRIRQRRKDKGRYETIQTKEEEDHEMPFEGDEELEYGNFAIDKEDDIHQVANVDDPEATLNGQSDGIMKEEEEDCDNPATVACTKLPASTTTTTPNDLIDMTQRLLTQEGKAAVSVVMMIFYVNVFLVLGDYMLVMADAVSAILDDAICFPHAGILASIAVLILTQIRRLGDLGKWITIISLSSLTIVVVQCLVQVMLQQQQQQASSLASQPGAGGGGEDGDDEYFVDPTQVPLLRKLSAIGSIGFATGTNKLLLNIRHEMKDRRQAPQMMGISMSIFGTVYVGISVLAGHNPPGFLFDVLPQASWSRRMAGLFLWIHIAVSYAINSQALCISLDQRFTSKTAGTTAGRRRGQLVAWFQSHSWLIWTTGLAIFSYLVANAIPFFKDLVALIGALTSIPLTLTIPILQFRKFLRVKLWCPSTRNLGGGEKDSSDVASYGLLVFSFAFLLAGLVGAIGSIELDWASHGKPFAC